MILTPENVSYILCIAGIVAIIFSIYHYFRNPQIKIDKVAIKLREDVNSLSAEVTEIKERHLTSVEKNIKELSGTIHSLALEEL